MIHQCKGLSGQWFCTHRPDAGAYLAGDFVLSDLMQEPTTLVVHWQYINAGANPVGDPVLSDVMQELIPSTVHW